MTNKILWTFSTLVKMAHFSEAPTNHETKISEEPQADVKVPTDKPQSFGALRPEFHYNIQVHLPANATEETYLNIFNALRKTFKP